MKVGDTVTIGRHTGEVVGFSEFRASIRIPGGKVLDLAIPVATEQEAGVDETSITNLPEGGDASQVNPEAGPVIEQQIQPEATLKSASVLAPIVEPVIESSSEPDPITEEPIPSEED